MEKSTPMRSIASFKLHKRGEQGISVSSSYLSKLSPVAEKDLPQEANNIYHDQTTTFRNEEVPDYIIKAIQRLKYFLLSICGYWIPVFNEHMDWELFSPVPMESEGANKGREFLHGLFDRITVTQVEADRDGFVIRGQMDVIDNKPLNLNPARVTHDDDLDYFGEAKDIISAIMKILYGYFSTYAIEDMEDYKRYLLSHSNETQKHEIAKYTDDQVLNTLMDKMMKEGWVIMAADDSKNEDEVQVADVIPPDVDLEPEPEEAAEEKGDWKPPVEKVKDPFGPPAAEQGQAEPVSEEMQYTENVGDDDDDFV